jgi:hypothetical protein
MHLISWQGDCRFFHTIYYVVASWSGNKVKIYLQGSNQKDGQGMAHKQVCLLASLQVLGGEDPRSLQMRQNQTSHPRSKTWIHDTCESSDFSWIHDTCESSGEVRREVRRVIFFTHIFRSKYFVSPLECFQCLLMFSKLNCGNGL